MTRAAADGLTKAQRYKRKPADLVSCPVCHKHWQRTNQQRADGTLCCSMRCAAHVGNVGRSIRANRDAVVRYRRLIRARLSLDVDQARDVEIRDVLLLMLEARRDGIRCGRQRKRSSRAERDASRAEVARLTALPPLPEGWVSNGDVNTYGWREYVGPDLHLVHVDTCGVHVGHGGISDVVVADLITVLRHAEREHQRLREGWER